MPMPAVVSIAVVDFPPPKFETLLINVMRTHQFLRLARTRTEEQIKPAAVTQNLRHSKRGDGRGGVASHATRARRTRALPRTPPVRLGQLLPSSARLPVRRSSLRPTADRSRLVQGQLHAVGGRPRSGSRALARHVPTHHWRAQRAHRRGHKQHHPHLGSEERGAGGGLPGDGFSGRGAGSPLLLRMPTSEMSG